MKQYADRRENFIKQKNETLKDVLKNNLQKLVIYEKALEEKTHKY